MDFMLFIFCPLDLLQCLKLENNKFSENLEYSVRFNKETNLIREINRKQYKENNVPIASMIVLIYLHMDKQRLYCNCNIIVTMDMMLYLRSAILHTRYMEPFLAVTKAFLLNRIVSALMVGLVNLANTIPAMQA